VITPQNISRGNLVGASVTRNLFPIHVIATAMRSIDTSDSMVSLTRVAMHSQYEILVAIGSIGALDGWRDFQGS